MSDIPTSEPPPPYSASAGSSAKKSIPLERRRSMEDELRPLPPNWVRQFDKASNHQFFVDTSADPPRSIWHHPYDDDEYLSTLSPEERREITTPHHTAANPDIKSSSSKNDFIDERDDGITAGPSTAPPNHSAATSRPDAEPTGLHKLGRRMKDKITHSTHAQRVAERQHRAEEEETAYRAHLALRAAMIRSMETGQPQFLGRDANGKDVYLEPPNGPRAPAGAYGYNPYSEGPYANPNARFVRPAQPYARGGGYGGAGLGLPLLGGLFGGLLLGELLF